ncbi:MAG: TolB protein [Solirubrobacteraceae bacterium]|jgi:hypothetical protein|nr:TolB protein [Solirubrobacteraceae bacterium]
MAALACAVTVPPASAATNGVIAVTTPAAPTKLATLAVEHPAPTIVPGLPRDSTDGAWSPDGRMLAFTSTLRGKPDIYVASVTGELRLITLDDADNREPTWSPDGRRIAYASRRACPARPRNRAQPRPACPKTSDIYVIGLASGARRRITTDTGDDRRPAWSPDGTLIAYEGQQAGHTDIWVTAPDGSARRKLTSAGVFAATDEAHPAWSPDSARLAFSGGVPGGYAVASIARSGLDARPLTKRYAASPFPAWSPDGLQIAFSVDRDLLLMPSSGVVGMDAQLLASGATRPAWAAVPAPSTAGPSASIGVPVMDARALRLQTTIDASDGVLLTFRRAGAPELEQDSTALIQDATFMVLKISPQAPTLRIKGESCERFRTAGQSSTSRGRAYKPKRGHRPRRATLKANGDFKAVTNQIIAAPEGTRYVVSVTCHVEAVDVETGVVTVRMRKATDENVRVPAGGRSVVTVVYPSELKKKSPRIQRLFGKVKGRFRTRGRQSAATVKG